MSSSHSQPSTAAVKSSSRKRKRKSEEKMRDDGAADQSESAGSSGSNSDSELDSDDDNHDLSKFHPLKGDEHEENGLSEKALEAYKAAQNLAGVVYISRIPPGMSPDKVRHLMSAYGEVGKVFLQPEGTLSFALPSSLVHFLTMTVPSICHKYCAPGYRRKNGTPPCQVQHIENSPLYRRMGGIPLQNGRACRRRDAQCPARRWQDRVKMERRRVDHEIPTQV